MERAVNAVNYLLQKLISEYGIIPTLATDCDITIANDLQKYLMASLTGTVEESETLDFIDGEFCEIDYPEGTVDDEEEMESSPEWEQDFVIGREFFSLEYMKRVLAFFDSRKTRKFERTQAKFQKVSHSSYISRFRLYVSQQGMSH